MKSIFFCFIIAAFISCKTETNSETQIKTTPPILVEEKDIKETIKESQLATKKDPVCGMPAYKFLKDTTLFDNKIYGFCGKGCKDEFLKTPKIFSIK